MLLCLKNYNYGFKIIINIIERQEEATVKRIKLEYDDIGSSGREYLGVWETIVNKENHKYDAKMLRQAIRQGKNDYTLT